MHAQEMISSHPQVQGNTNDILIRAVEETFACAQTCVSCADACLGEDMVAELTECIRLNLDCADVCITAGKTATRRTGSNEAVIAAILDACVVACARCGEECGRHAEMHEHCRICADACRSCETACRQARDSISVTVQ